MFKKHKWLKYTVLTILLGMVFAVNVGWTYASFDYSMKVNGNHSSEASDDTNWSYLKDIVINNSTIETPIPYSLGTVNREINFDYGFSGETDIAVVYSLSYTDGTEVTNVSLNVADRDNYILDVPTTISKNGTTQYDGQADRGTLYYLNTLSGMGNKVLFSGVTFYGGNNQVSVYKAESAISLYKSSYQVGDVKNTTEFKYTSVDVARYWEISAYSNGTDTITVEDYNALSASEQNQYSVSQYKCKQGYTIAGSSVSLNTTASVSEYKNYINAGESKWTVQYVCNTACTIDGTSYVLNQEISQDTYNTLTSNQGYFSKQYKCTTAYTVQGTSYKTVAKNGTITSEEYKNLYYLEQVNFVPSEYVGFEGKKLKINVKVYAKANVSETDEEVTDYYSADHYFINFKQQLVSQALNNWLLKKANNITSTKLMIYNAHGEFDKGIPYAYDYSSTVDLSTQSAKADIRSSYVYNTDGTVYSYASGNSYHAGVGVYYLASQSGTLKCSFGANWYNPSGAIVSSMPINNIEFKVNSSFNELGSNEYGYSKVISSGGYGYIDLLDYIQTTTKADIVNLVGYRLVITSVTVEFVTDYSSWTTQPSGSATKEAVKVINMSNYNHVLYTYAGNMQTSSTINADLTIFNDSDDAKIITSLNVTPKFVAYNGLTSSGFGVARTKYLSFGDAGSSGTRIMYNSSSWTKSSGSNNSYNFSSNGIYIAPHTSLKVISGIYVVGQTLSDWKITVGDNGYYADYWFEFELNSISYSTTTATKTSTTDAELITTLTTASINAGESSYVAVRNNTFQTMTSISFSGTFVTRDNPTNSISYSLTNYSTNSTATQTSNQISISLTNINLLPGESVIICKITAGSSMTNLGFTSCSSSASLGSAPSYTSIYAKRDFASGNLTIINPTTDKTNIKVSLTAGSASLSDPSILTSGTDKWAYENSQFRYTQKKSSEDAYIQAGQILNVLSSYYANNVTTTFAN